jgi:peptidoglycan/xylan/chitin deacetylase (PgdA/CDA1 family)
MATKGLAAPVTGIAASPGGGYRLVATDGGVFCFGAPFRGSAAGTARVGPIVAIASGRDDEGYWLAGADGGVFAIGDVGFFGSVGGTAVANPVTSIVRTPDGQGYWLLPVVAPAPQNSSPAPTFPAGPAPVVSFGSPAGGAFYITIDDGYTPSDQVLQLMQSQHLPVTAFLTSTAAAQNLSFWRAFSAAGGDIEDHTVSHPDLTRLSQAAAESQWADASSAFRSWFGVTTTLGRPPYSAVNPSVQVAARQAGLRTLVLWSASMYNSQLTTYAGRPLRAGEIVILHWIPGLYDNVVRLLSIASTLGLHPAPLLAGLGGI